MANKHKRAGILKAGLVISGLAFLANCASFSDPNLRRMEEIFNQRDNIAKELGVKSNQVVEIRPGLYTTISGELNLMVAEGVRQGKLQVEKTKNGYRTRGKYSGYISDKTIEEANVNRDNKITWRESVNKGLEEYEKAYESRQRFDF